MSISRMYGGISATPPRVSDERLVGSLYPVHAEIFRPENIKAIQSAVFASWGVSVPDQEVAQMIRLVYSLRADASLLERRAVESGDLSRIWGIVDSINRDAANRLGKLNSVYSTLDDYERYARIFLGDEQPEGDAIPHPFYTVNHRKRNVERLDGSNILGDEDRYYDAYDG
eukprot:jgi/Mesvir1/24168/Mv10885-RA.1